ncbi:hypothetical protein ACFYO1_02205 [Nocardia sp. NPDC006044]|uniref:hypothetical protein n=1 Tax=Nocardia sp. NPDC006044 TaxID=3364306 RepID=UPI0036C2D028
MPAARAPRLRGTELADPQQLIRLFRATYGAAQGRQWLQAHIFWWSLTFLRDNGISLDLETLSDPVLGQKVVAMALPRGHAGVEPKGQAEMNFGLWWAIFIDVAQTVFRQRRRMLPDPGPALPDATSLRLRATNLGLHQWMSSATFEELAGITAALEMIGDRERRGRPTADEIMTEVLLPELLLTEMHWLHAPNGRTNSPGNPRADIVFLRRYARARARWADERQLNPVDQMYLRAGDILDHFDQLDQNERRALNLDSMLSMYDDIRHADLAVPR